MAISTFAAEGFNPWRIKISFSGYDRDETLENFPVLVSLNTNIAGFSYDLLGSPADGADLRFKVSSDGDELNYAIGSWNTNGISHIWVQAPELASSNDYIYAYFGDESATVPTYTTNGATWSAVFQGVWHMQDATNVLDSSGNANHGTGSTGIGSSSSGIAGNALSLNGTSHHVDCGTGLNMRQNDATISIWFKTSTATFDAGFIGKTVYADAVGRYGLYRSGANMSGIVQFSGGHVVTSHSWNYSDGEWHLATVTYKRNGNMTVYVDGVQKSAADISAHSSYDMSASYRFWIGAYGNNTGTAPQTGFLFPGQLDEARMMNVAVSSNWIWTAWANQKPGSTFLTYGAVEEDEPSVYVSSPTDIGLTTATIHGRLIGLWAEPNPELYLCWGEEDAGAEATNAWDQVVLMGDAWEAGQFFSYAASGFTQGSTNFFRIFATNDANVAWSDMQVFTNYSMIVVATLPLGAEDIGIVSAELRGEVTDTGGMVPEAGFEWWPTGGSATSSVSMGLQSGTFSTLAVGLTRNQEYTFRVWATNTAAGLVVSDTATFTTLDDDPRTLTWNGSVSSDWFNPDNWDDAAGTPPANDDIIIINSGSVLLTNQTAMLSSFTISNATLTFSNWTTRLQAASVDIGNNGVLTLPAAFAYGEGIMSNRVHIVAGSLLVETGGKIDVFGKGYRVGTGPAKGSQSGSNNNGGGGHGGRGGNENGGSGGPEWGVAETPVWPGSGGGQYLSTAGGNGGGAVRIEAGSVTVNGTIDANGEHGSTYNGGGAGGAVYITSDTFAGANGLIRANGGNGGSAYVGGGAGGGRIAVDYENITGECSVLFSTKAGLKFSSIPAEAGTLWFPDTALINDGLDTRFDHVRLIVPGWTSQTVDKLEIDNRNVAFGEEGFHLTVTSNLTVRNNGSLIIGGKAIAVRTLLPDSSIPGTTNVTVTVGGDVEVEGGSLTIGGLGQTGRSYLNVAGDVILTDAAANAGRLFVGSGVTNGTDLIGGFVSIAGTLSIASNAWYQPYSHPVNGGSVRLQSASGTIAAGGGIDANMGGFQSYANIAYGYGAGVSSGSRGGGGGHGGAGGRGAAAGSHGGGVYGETNRPLHTGSAGGFGHSPLPGYGHGGGYVRIETGPLVLNGSITANGRNAISSYGGGGSGGGVFILCDSLEGSASGLISARGGNGGSVAGGGGGGRMAVAIGMSPADRTKLIDGDEVDGLFVYYTHGPFLGTVSVTNGISPSGYIPLPEPGSAVFMTVAAGTFSLVVEGNPGDFGTPQPHNYGTTIGIAEYSIITNSVVTPANEANGLRWACIGWRLTDESENLVDEDVTAQAVFPLYANRILTWNWTNEYELVVDPGPNGSVNSVSVDGWYTAAVHAAGITATADSGYHFTGWIGDVPEESMTNNPLTLVMDQPRTIQAEFASISGQAKAWNGTGAWSDYNNWTPPGAPGPNDTITIASGNLLLPASRTVKAATVNSGATVVFTNWNTVLTAGQDVTIAGTVTIPPPFRYDTAMSNRVWMICRDLTLSEGGVINIDAKGYFTHTGPGSTTGGGSNRGSGAGHGGRGGNSLTIAGGAIYGVTNAPLMPGSGGGGSYDNLAGHGGGAVWIDASRDVVIDGLISANGGGGGTYNGGGAGGSIFIIAGNSFAGGETGIIRANGGNRGTGYAELGGGGGGRIAIWHQASAMNPASRMILLAGGTVDRLGITPTLPTYLGIATADAATLSYAPPEDGTVIFLRELPPAGAMFKVR